MILKLMISARFEKELFQFIENKLSRNVESSIRENKDFTQE